ncbi:MAG TPA: EamA family transporter [bacterium]|nr:EamA family transporter [bacterium]
MSIWVALLLISLCAVLWDAGIILQKLAVDTLPSIRMDRGLGQSVRRLLTSGRWMAGLAASAVGWGLFAWALAFTPISVARSIQGFGFVILAVFSMVFLRQKLGAADWAGIVMVTAGVAALGLAERTPGEAAASISVWGLLPGVIACLLLALGVRGAAALRRDHAPGVVVFSISAGLLLGVGDVLTKVAIVQVQASAWGVLAVAAAGLVAFYISGFLVLSRAYQHGRPITVTAVSDLCARLVAISLGVAALGEVPAAQPLARVLTVAGFASILTGAFLLSKFGGAELAAALSGQAAAGSQHPGKPQEREHAVTAKVDPDL